jgi:HSP20 family molecular chaperone IbpA
MTHDRTMCNSNIMNHTRRIRTVVTQENPHPITIPWENQPQHYPMMIPIVQRRQLALAIRMLLLRQKRAYHRRFELLQEQYNQRLQQQPMSELTENENLLRLTIDVPGVNIQDIQVQVEKSSHVLSVSANRLCMSIDGTSCVRTQMICRRYSINYIVVDQSQIQAMLSNGVLTITAPKKKVTLTGTNSKTSPDSPESCGFNEETMENNRITHISISQPEAKRIIVE